MRIIKTEHCDEWMRILEHSFQHDIYHTSGYHSLAEERGEGTAHLFVHEEEGYMIALPLLIREIDAMEELQEAGTGWRDATSVYGYAGPVASHREIPQAVLDHFRTSLFAFLKEHCIVAVFSRLHPLIPQNDILSGMGECIPAGKTVSIDLTLPEEVQRGKFRSDHVRCIKKMRRLEYVCIEDKNLTYLSRFIEIYNATMLRVKAKDYYFFERSYFEQLIRRLSPDCRLFVVLAGDEVACCSLIGACSSTLQYHLGGTPDKFLKQAPMKLLLDEVRLWGIKNGFKTFHLGGGVGGKIDSLFSFKAGFSDRTHPFCLWRWTLYPKVYNTLCTMMRARNEQNGRVNASPDYFPEYSCPTISRDETSTEPQEL